MCGLDLTCQAHLGSSSQTWYMGIAPMNELGVASCHGESEMCVWIPGKPWYKAAVPRESKLGE